MLRKILGKLIGQSQPKAVIPSFEKSDTILVCFPKCGSTWLEIMMTQYFQSVYGVHTQGVRDMFRLTNQLDGIDTLIRTHDDDPHLKRVEDFETDKSKYKDKKVIFLTRDPRDVMISYFFEYTKKKEYLAANEPPFTGTPNDFLTHHIGGIEHIVSFMNLWAKNTETPKGFLMVRYELLHENVEQEMRNIISFLGEKNIDEEALQKAIEFADFSNMRKLEEKGTAGLRLNPNVKVGDTEGYKTRKGKVGGYVEYLDQDHIDQMNGIISQKLDDYFACYK